MTDRDMLELLIKAWDESAPGLRGQPLAYIFNRAKEHVKNVPVPTTGLIKAEAPGRKLDLEDHR